MNQVGIETLQQMGGEFCLQWCIALLHFLWQGALIGLLVLVAGRFLRKRSAEARYTLHAMALLSLPVCLVTTFAVLEQRPSTPTSATSASVSTVDTQDNGLPPILTTAKEIGAEQDIRTAVTVSPVEQELPASDARPSITPAASPIAAMAFLARVAPLVTGIYLAGVLCFFLRFVLAAWGGHRLCWAATRVEDSLLLERIVDQSRKIGLRFVPLVKYCEKVAVPTVIGVIRPVILLPVSGLMGLEPEQLAVILAHELAHIRRYDLAMNLVQRVVESLLFFHPVVWYVSRHMSAERETCCDDLVVALGSEPMRYAGALLRMAELCAAASASSSSPGLTALGASGATPSQLELRIRRLMNAREHSRLRLTRAGISIFALLLLSVVLTPAVLHAWVRAQDATEEPTIEEPAHNDTYNWACTTVDKETGEPIAGVRISWDFRNWGPIKERVDLSLWKKEFVSDSNGEYKVSVPKTVFEAANIWIAVEHHHPRYRPRRNTFWPLRMPEDPVGQGLDHRHAQLEPGVKVTGLVVNPDGSPAGNVPVMFARSRDGFGDSNGGYRHGFWTRTDDQGRYTFYTRNIWPQRIHWFPNEYEANSRALTKTFGEQERIRLKSGLSLVGKVLDTQGEPIEGVVVRASTGTRVPYMFATSDVEGVFRFAPLPPGDYYLAPVRSYHDNLSGDSLSAVLPFPLLGISYLLSDATASTEPKAVIQASPLIKIPVEVVDVQGNLIISNKRLTIGAMSDFMNSLVAKPLEGSPGKYEFLFPRDQDIGDLQLQRSMSDAAFYQINRNHPPVAAETILLGKFQEDVPTIRVVLRRAAELTVMAHAEDGKEPTELVRVSARHGSEIQERIEAAEQANRDPRVYFTLPRMFHTNPANRPWNPTFKQLIPGEPVEITIQSEHYTAEPLTVTLKEGEKRTIELLLKRREDRESP